MPRTADRKRSNEAFRDAGRVLVGGVNSPVRAYAAVGGQPVFAAYGRGARVRDLDGNEYVDYVGAYGPLILGHAHPAVTAAIREAAGQGSSFGMPTTAETHLAQLVVEAVPSVQMVRFVNSGTEAVLSVIRLARAVTGRDRLVKCTGGYHGHVDPLLVQAGSGATTLGTPSSPGVPEAVAGDTLLVPFNDPDAAERLFALHGGQIACLIVEPVAGNMGCVPPRPGYLNRLRELCDAHGSLLIFDEVMTGFRVSFGGAQQLYDVRPDLTCLGKIIGGGLPCAAYGGPVSLMEQVAPAGPVYQAGTLSGNPLAMAAGTATVEALRDGGAYEILERCGRRLAELIADEAQRCDVPVCLNRVGSMIGCFFLPASGNGPIRNYEEALASDTKAYGRFFNVMLDHGVLLPPSQFETWFLSTEHDERCLQQTATAAREAFRTLAEVPGPQEACPR